MIENYVNNIIEIVDIIKVNKKIIISEWFQLIKGFYFQHKVMGLNPCVLLL